MTEVAKTEKNEVMDPNANAMGLSGELSNDDVQQGRLTLMQANAKLVKAEEQRQGSLIDLVTGEEHAYKGNAKEEETLLEFTICGMMKYWIEKDADTDEFIAKYPGANQNEKEWEENVNGRNIKRTFHFSYVVLLTKEIEEGIEMPYELAFRSTAVKETKKLNTAIQKRAMKGIPSHKLVFNARIVERSKNDDTWWGLDLSVADRPATEKEEQVTKEHFASFMATKEKFMSQQEDTYGNQEAGASKGNATAPADY